MNDRDEPPCPNCGVKLRKAAERENPNSILGVDAFIYTCPDCGALWNDNLDGEPLHRRAEKVQ